MTDLRSLFAPELVDAIERLVDERVAVLVEAQGKESTPWLTIDEAANYVRVSPRTLERLVRSGKVRTETIGRRRLAHRDELDAYMRGGNGGGVTPATPPRRRLRSLDVGSEGA